MKQMRFGTMLVAGKSRNRLFIQLRANQGAQNVRCSFLAPPAKVTSSSSKSYFTK